MKAVRGSEQILEYSLENDGFEVHRQVFDLEIMEQCRRDIWNVITELAQIDSEFPQNASTYLDEATEILWDLFNKNPGSRNDFYNYSQRIPTLHYFANHPVVKSVVARFGLKKASVRELKLHFYFPWEKSFFQPVHQDINSLDSAKSLTFTIPFHENNVKHSVSFWRGSHREGPVRHEQIIEEEYAVFHVKVPDQFLSKYLMVTPTFEGGDLGVHNRLCFHKSPSYEEASRLRISLVMIFDDLAAGGVFRGKTTKYQDYTPNTLSYHDKVILPTIKAYLAQKPKINWPEKRMRLLERDQTDLTK